MKTNPLLHITAISAAISTAGVLTCHGSLTWTGEGNSISLYAENNWRDDNGATPANNTINGGSDVTAVTGGLIEINSGAGQPSNFSPGFQVGTGNSLTVGGGKTLASGSNAEVVGGGAATTLTVTGGATLNVGNVSNFGTISADASTVDLSAVTGVTDLSLTNVSGSINSLTMASGIVSMAGTAPSITTLDFTGVNGHIANLSVTSGTMDFAGGNNVTFGNLTVSNTDITFAGSKGLTSSATFPSQITLTNGSTWISQFVSNNTTLFVDATSSIELKGGGDPINSQTNQTTVNLETGAQLIFRNTGELDDQLNDSGSGDIWVNGVRVTALNKDTLLNTSDSLTYTAIPEPSSSALIGLASIALILRRRQ